MDGSGEIDERISCNSKIFETFLSTIWDCLQKDRFEDMTWKLLFINVEIFKSNKLKFSPSIENYLSNIVVHCSRKCYESASNTGEDIHSSSMFDAIAVILSVLDSNRIVSAIVTTFPGTISALTSTLECAANNERRDESLTKSLRLLDVYLTSLAERGARDFFNTVSVDEKITFEKLIPRVLLYEEPKFRMYSLSIMTNYYCLTRSIFFIDEIWKNIICRLLEDESSTETCLAILTHLFRSQIELNEKSTASNWNEFWMVLKKCFQSDAGMRKHALPVLKYVVFNCDFHSECRAWWKTYFTINDILDEKQSHLVLPALRLMRTLSNCEVEVDDFWVLSLIEQAMLHDSRTVRMKAFENLFDLDVNRFRIDHVPIVVKIMRVFNDSTLFRKILQTQSLDTFKNRFSKWINALSLTPCGINFNSLLLHDIISQKWSPVPLYYILEILSEHPYTFTKFTCDHDVKTFIQSVTRMHNICIRSAVQNLFLRILLKSKNCDFDTVIQIFEFLKFCNEKECLQRETRTWSEICDVIRLHVAFSIAEKWLMREFSLKLECAERSSASILLNLARDIVLLHDALGVLRKSNLVREYFAKISTLFKTAKSDAYINTKVLDNNLKLLVSLMNYGITIDEVIHCSHVEILAYVFERIERNSNNSKLIDFYMDCLKEINTGSVYETEKKLSNMVNERLPKICCDVSMYSNLMLVEWIRKISQKKIHLNVEDWGSIIDLKIRNFVNANKEKSFILDCGKNQMSGSMNMAISNYMNSFWRLFTLCTKEIHENLQEYFDPTTVFNLVFEGFHLARNENLVSLFRALKYICGNNVVLSCEESMVRLMDQSWKKLEEIQATPYYQGAVRHWIPTFIQRSLLRCKMYHFKIEFFMNEFLEKAAENGEQSFKYVITILEQLLKIEDVHLVFPPIINILVRTFCTVHISRKDQRVEYDTMNRIRMYQTEYLTLENTDADFIHASEEVRLRALNLILRTIEAENSPAICVSMIETLTRINESSKKRYFGDSLYHRTKHKQLQLLLVLEFIFNRKYDSNSMAVVECFEKMYDFAVRSLLGEPHQPSIRYMLEWLLILLVIHKFSKFEDKFWSSFSEASEERIGSICSFIMIAFHLANVLKNESFVDRAVKSMLPWSMAQHFNARLYAQSVLTKLINLNEKVKQEYQILEYSLISCLKRGNAVKNSVKLQEDFYFSHFDPQENFSLQTILWELPRLSNISRDEWIQIDLYSQFLTQDYGIPLLDSESNCLSKFECSSWITKANTTTNESYAEVLPEVSETQRKFIPSNEDVMTGQICGQMEKRGDLIVVGSLIDRMPNLGGLTRTCEIFAVSTLVLDSLDVVRNKEFTSLSITAEKHVPLTEVKRYSLFSFLKSMKEQRYCIIGIEQATSSRPLNNFIFPSKSIIVLGNEKEGISADLLPVLDVCIEIPQVGVIRSLNVHVSASLIIWEYAKQHIFTS